ncbi:hypothetical protein GCM10008083_12490 [Ulvibacter litoralis]|nr:hypothetical protein GCM10008083_12490 [Ulvibacter litoralis]
MLAQCPPITNPNPVICDAAGLRIIHLDTYATDLGAGLDWYDAPTGGTKYVDTQLLREGTYYADNSAGTCGTRSSLVVDFVVDPTGQNLDGIFCDNENPTVQTYIDEVLAPNTPPGGAAVVYTNLALTNQANPATVLTGTSNFYIVFEDLAGCRSQIEFGSTATFSAPATPTPPLEQHFCSDTNPTVANLDPGTTLAFNWYDDIDTNGDPIDPSLDGTTPLIDGNTYYIQAEGIFCDSDLVAVLVILDDPVNPGTNASLEYCENAVPTNDFDLFPLLGNNPDTTGSWTGPLPTQNGHLGTVNISTLNPGIHTFIYTVEASGTCPSGMSTVTILISELLSSGTPSGLNPATFCETDLPSDFDLFTLLEGYDLNGTWTTGTTSGGTVITSPIDLTGYTAGTYNFTYTQNAAPSPCPEETTTVQIIILPEPNPGNAINAVFCENDLAANSPFNLFDALDGTQDNGGVWTDASGTAVTNPIDITTFTVAGSPYTFIYTLNNGTCEASETITISVLPSPNSGEALPPIDICFDDLSANSPFDLFTLLDGSQDMNGTWYEGSNASGTAVTNPIDLTTLAVGTHFFTYSVPNIGSCSDAPTTVQINITEAPNAGTAIPTIFCENDVAANSPFDLFDALDGSQDNNGGIWTDASGTVVTNPIDISGFTVAGSPYTFTYTIVTGSCDASETITISVLPSPNSGEALPPIDICFDDLSANSPFDLFTLLDGSQDMNGTWYEGSNTSGTAVTNPIDLTTLAVGTHFFTYSVPNIGSCSDAPTTVQITIVEAPNAGTAIPTIFCEADLAANSPFDLFDALDGSQDNNGGVWTDASGTVVTNPIDISGFTVAGSPYTFTYTIVTGSCDASETITITVVESPNTGVALDPLQLCEDEIGANSPFDLFDLLDGSQDLNGTWYEGTNTSGTVATNPIDLTTLGFGTFNYTYAVPAIGSCSDSPVTVQIELNESPETGTATPFVVCEDDLGANSPLDLFGQLSGNDAGGTWNDDDATGALTGSMVDLTALTVGTYNFTYSIISSEGCESATTVPITIENAANAGTATNVALCMVEIPNNPTIDLFSQIAGNDTGGTWNDDDASGALTGSTVDLTALTVGVYNFTYTVLGTGTCSDDAVTVTITISDSAAPTAPSPQDFCDSATVSNLEATGTALLWYDSLTASIPLAGTTPLTTDTTYYVTQTTANGCESSVRTAVLVHINESPNSGVAVVPPVTVCTDNTTVDLNTGLDGSQDASGVWQDTDGTGALTANIFDASQVSAGTYTFTYFVAGTPPCVDASTTITVTVQDAVSAGTNATLDICDTNAPIDLFTLLGAADTGGTWSPALASGTSVFDPILDDEGVYTYSISNTCSSDSSTVTIAVTSSPNAGISTAASLCVVDGPVNLFDVLEGTPDATGTWFPVLASGSGIFDPTVDTAGIYTYTVLATAPCTGDASAQINITVNNSPEPTVVQATISFCASENPTVADLFGTVSGSNITWYNELDDTTPLDLTTPLVDGEDYFSSQTNSSGCESSQRSEVTVTVSDAPTPTLIDEGVTYCINERPTLDTLSENVMEASNQEYVINWYDDETEGNLLTLTTVLENNTTYYAALLNVALGCESSVRLPVTVDLTGCLGFTVPDGFSPNGDGTNDTFDIDNLDFLFPNFTMEIYNRYGSLVYMGNANTSRFDGTSNQSGVLNKGNLPVGVYFYILNVNDGITEPQSGRLYLSR